VAEADAPIDACALLELPEIESVAGERVRDTTSSRQGVAGLNVSHCYFSLGKENNSIVLTVTQPAGRNGGNIRKWWDRKFGMTPGKNQNVGDDDQLRERDPARERQRDDETEPPLSVKGIGEQAFWLRSQSGGTLHVLKGDSYIQLSIGGIADTGVGLGEATRLAEFVVNRL
jgi:hypothetical protein